MSAPSWLRYGGAAAALAGLGGAAAWLRRRAAESAEGAPAAPAPAPQRGAQAPAAGAPPRGVFVTPREAAEVRGDWADIGEGVELTRMPLFDGRADVRARGVSFARLTYADALAVAQRLGARLPTAAELDRAAAHRSARVLAPCILDPGPQMASEEWARRHDQCVVAQLEIRTLEPGEILVNAGKHWAAGAPTGRAINHGWYDRADVRKMIQRSGTKHDAAHTDYSQTTILARDRGGSWC